MDRRASDKLIELSAKKFLRYRLRSKRILPRRMCGCVASFAGCPPPYQSIYGPHRELLDGNKVWYVIIYWFITFSSVMILLFDAPPWHSSRNSLSISQYIPLEILNFIGMSDCRVVGFVLGRHRMYERRCKTHTENLLRSQMNCFPQATERRQQQKIYILFNAFIQYERAHNEMILCRTTHDQSHMTTFRVYRCPT